MKNPRAAASGKLGGSKRSKDKAKSSRANGKLGGRPASKPINWTKFMDAVDACRREASVKPLNALAMKSRSNRERALLNATARFLCHEFQIEEPRWINQFLWLKEPWFVSEMENLKASALVESPLEFRANNIFVLGNFLSRA